MRLYFQINSKNEIQIGRPSTLAECSKIIEAFFKEHKYKSYYTRFYKEGDTAFYKSQPEQERYVFDFGSYSQFFILETETPEERAIINQELGDKNDKSI